jgi:hypothetical protein
LYNISLLSIILYMRVANTILIFIAGILIVLMIGLTAVYAQDPPLPPPTDDTDVVDDDDLQYKDDEPLDERDLDSLDPWFLENEPNTVDKEKKNEQKEPEDTKREP